MQLYSAKQENSASIMQENYSKHNFSVEVSSLIIQWCSHPDQFSSFLKATMYNLAQIKNINKKNIYIQVLIKSLVSHGSTAQVGLT